jgi:hypothetical protein
MTIRSCVLLLALCASGYADTLILRSGTRVTGRWWAADADVISFLVNSQLEQYPRADVSEVVFGAAETATGPDQTGGIYFQDERGNLLPLERSQNVAHSNASGGAPDWEIPGTRSTLRVKSAAKMQFVVEMPDGKDPAAFTLYPLKIQGNARQISAMTVPFTATKAAGNSYVLTPSHDLEPGEYSFHRPGSTDAFCFGIDPAAPEPR